MIGFSVQDKIVVFDRIRENNRIHRKISFEKLANHSIVQTLGRSINTQLMTSEFMLLALALLGGVTLREFAIILLVGLIQRYLFFHFHCSPNSSHLGKPGMENLVQKRNYSCSLN